MAILRRKTLVFAAFGRAWSRSRDGGLRELFQADRPLMKHLRGQTDGASCAGGPFWRSPGSGTRSRRSAAGGRLIPVAAAEGGLRRRRSIGCRRRSCCSSFSCRFHRRAAAGGRDRGDRHGLCLLGRGRLDRLKLLGPRCYAVDLRPHQTQADDHALVRLGFAKVMAFHAYAHGMIAPYRRRPGRSSPGGERARRFWGAGTRASPSEPPASHPGAGRPTDAPPRPWASDALLAQGA